MCRGRIRAWSCVALACLAAAGCRIERREQAAAVAAGAAPPPGGSFANQAFDPKAQVADIWAGKVLPSLRSRAGELAALRREMKADLDAAGAQHGHRERGEGAPWNFVTRLQGRILGGDVSLSAARIDVDVDADGQPDAQVQIGPVLRGTALRDSLPFISFTSYTNQVEFAQLANAFNDHAAAVALQGLPREQLAGREVKLLGVFTAEEAEEPPLILPVELQLGDR